MTKTEKQVAVLTEMLSKIQGIWFFSKVDENLGRCEQLLALLRTKTDLSLLDHSPRVVRDADKIGLRLTREQGMETYLVVCPSALDAYFLGTHRGCCLPEFSMAIIVFPGIQAGTVSSTIDLVGGIGPGNDRRGREWEALVERCRRDREEEEK